MLHLHRKNGFAEDLNLKIQLDTDLKIILLVYQNNYTQAKMSKLFAALFIMLECVLHNYFDSPIIFKSVSS